MQWHAMSCNGMSCHVIYLCVCVYVCGVHGCLYVQMFFSWVCLKDTLSNVCSIYNLHTSTVWWCLFIFNRIYKLLYIPPSSPAPMIFLISWWDYHSRYPAQQAIHNEVFYVVNMAADFQPDVVVLFAVCRCPNAGVWFENDSRSIAATGKTRVQFAVEGNEFTCNAGLDGYWQCGQCGMIFTDPEDGELASVLPKRRDKTTLKKHEPLKRMQWKILVWFSLCWST